MFDNPLASGILSDREITDLCICPDTKFDENKFWNDWKQNGETFWVEGQPLTGIVGFLSARNKTIAARSTTYRMSVTDEERDAFKAMITPFSPELIRKVCDWPRGGVAKGELSVISSTDTRKIISFGTSSYGYDARLSDDGLKLFTNIHGGEIDPKEFDSEQLLETPKIHTKKDGSRYVRIPPNSYLLGRTVERFNFPPNVTAVFIGKSTYARAGVFINTTPGEAAWRGHLVVEIGNLTNLPVRVYVDEGILQALMFQGNRICETSYDDRGGKYQDQEGVVMAKV
jgi:dCTP deaminase